MLKPARGCMLHGTSQQWLLERGGPVVHVLQNRKQKGMFVHVCGASILDEGMCMASPRRAPYSPRHLEGGSLPHLAFPP